MQYPDAVITLRGKLVRIERPLVMGILNVTPDSFYEESRVLEPREFLARAGEMLSAGADILDVGACSTRPGSNPPSEEEELRRLENVLPALRKEFPDAVLSVDTYRSRVAEECIVRWKADIINDAGGGCDPAMFETVGRHGVAYVLMHTRGTAETMDSHCDYPDGVVSGVLTELAFRMADARRAGICNLFVDPGFGFAKTTSQNYELLARLDELKVLGAPLLVGLSRKRMVREAAGCAAADSLPATTALNAVAIMKGASIIRVHDVGSALQCARAVSSVTDMEFIR